MDLARVCLFSFRIIKLWGGNVVRTRKLQYAKIPDCLAEANKSENKFQPISQSCIRSVDNKVEKCIMMVVKL